MENLLLSIVAILLVFIVIYISRLLTKIDELLIEINKCKNQIIRIVEIFNRVKSIEDKIDNWKKNGFT